MVADMSIWQKFWPLRDEVRKHLDEGTECDPAITKQWQDMRNHFVGQYYHLTQDVAKRMHKKITEVDEDALGSMGVDGLYDAVDGYDGLHPKTRKPVKFETYATYRIKGSILDEIRRIDWVPRLVRQRDKKLTETRSLLMAELGTDPTPTQMAAALKMSMEEYEEYLRSASLKTIQSLDTSVGSGSPDGRDGGKVAIVDCLPDRETPEPLERMMERELMSKLFGKGFTREERDIITGYYFDKRPMKEIGERVNLSESRVSQMNSAIMERIREKILRNPEFFGRQVEEMLQE